MSGYEISPLTSTRFGLGEGPFFDPKSSKLYIVDCFVGNFVSIDTRTKEEELINFSPHTVTFIIPTRSDDDEFVVSKNNHVCTLKWSTKELTSLMSVEDGEGTRFNDAKCDSRGRLWAGTMSGSEWIPPGKGSLYKMTPSAESGEKKIAIQKEFSPVILSNGITWTLDEKGMFFVDSIKKVIYKFSYDAETGNATDSEVFLDFESTPAAAGVPDGITTDSDGKLWLACYGGARILRIDPETAQVISTITTPCPNITSLTFGGPNLQTIFATSATSDQEGSDLSGSNLSGSVFAITSTKENVRGTQSSRFNDRI